MRRKKFLRRNTGDYSRLGRRRKKLMKWRRPRGRHNKMREKRTGYPAIVSIGYGTRAQERGKVNGLMPVRISNVQELARIGKNQIGILASVGKKKKIEIIKAAKEKGIKIQVTGKVMKKLEEKKTPEAKK